MRDTEVAHICPGRRPKRLDADPGNRGGRPEEDDPGGEPEGGDEPPGGDLMGRDLTAAPRAPGEA